MTKTVPEHGGEAFRAGFGQRDNPWKNRHEKNAASWDSQWVEEFKKEWAILRKPLDEIIQQHQQSGSPVWDRAVLGTLIAYQLYPEAWEEFLSGDCSNQAGWKVEDSFEQTRRILDLLNHLGFPVPKKQK